MSPIQQMLLGVGAVATKTYVDDVFSTFLYTGTGSAQTINNGIDLANEGGMVWFKSRTTGGSSYNNHSVVDTERVDSSGRGKSIYPNLTDQEFSPENTSNFITTSFNSNGYTTATNPNNATNTQTLASWTFRKSPMFDVVTYTGNGSNRTISHSLGSIPGMIIIKRTDTSSNWAVYHRGFNGGVNPEQYVAFLDTTDAEASHAASWNNSPPTSSVFHVGTHARVNGNGGTFVAYLFAGGESTAATARSVDFDGNDHLTFTNNSDLNVGTSDFCYEFWVFPNDYSAGNNQNLFSNGSSGIECSVKTDASGLVIRQGSDGVSSSGQLTTNSLPPEGQWTHVAITKSSGTMRIFFNGLQVASASNSTNYNGDGLFIGVYNNYWRGKISNFRLVKGTAVYTSSFRPPTEPLTNITNTKLLCCNNSSVTGSTVIPSGVSITANGDPTASSDSPFDDPAAHVFGESGSESVVKCGSFVASTDYDVWNNRVIELGWEPSFVMYKNASNTGNWEIFDTMRGFLATSDDSAMLEANTSDAEEAAQRITIEPTGFKERGVITTGDTVIYVAIRRPDGYVGKQYGAGEGTSVFAMDTSSASSVIPTFDSTFPVDFGLKRKTASTDHWLAGYRLLGQKSLSPDRTNSETDSGASLCWDSNLGFGKTFGTLNQGWMWKRHAGFDVVTYAGDGTSGHQIPHSLNKTVEMIWVKRRDDTKDWQVGHHGANGGSSPWNYYLELNQTQAEASQEGIWNNTAPTSTHFTVGNWTQVNNSSGKYLALLFSSVDGISKVGSYTGNGNAIGSSPLTITTDFQPRFLLIKRVDESSWHWNCFDSLRGIGSGNEPRLKLNSSDAQNTGYDWVEATSTGFKINGSMGGVGASGGEYIYYAHA